MKFTALFPLLLLGAVPALQESVVPPRPEVLPFADSFPTGMLEVQRLAEEEKLTEALGVTEQLLAPTRLSGARSWLSEKTGGATEFLFTVLDGPLEWLGLEMRTAREQGQVHYARGVVIGRMEEDLRPDPSFDLARQLAGDTESRPAAIYNLGTLELLRGEAKRAEIPEVSGAAPMPPMPPVPGEEPPPDPLEVARAHYLGARENFVERLRCDWRDADTRANVELVIRRLRELEDIEKQREEQEQEDPNEEESEEPSDEESEPSDEEPPEEPPESEEPQDSEEPQGDEEEQEQPPQEPEGEPEESLEEMMRLLQRLQDHEEEGERVRAELNRARAERVRRDW